jgi:hypothetical protein
MNDETNETERFDVLDQTGEDIRSVASAETAAVPPDSRDVLPDPDVEIESVLVFENEGIGDGEHDSNSAPGSPLIKYAPWVGAIAGAVAIAVVVLRLRARRQKQMQVVEEQQKRFARLTASLNDMISTTSGLRQRLSTPWSRGDVEVVDTPTERTVMIHLPWKRNGVTPEPIQQEPELSRWQTIAARVPRPGGNP